MPFSSFIEFCKRILSKGDRPDESETLQSVVPDADMCNLLTNDREQIYLAQVVAFSPGGQCRFNIFVWLWF